MGNASLLRLVTIESSAAMAAQALCWSMRLSMRLFHGSEGPTATIHALEHRHPND